LKLGAYEIALIGVGGTTVDVLIGALLTYHFSLRLSEINAKRQASLRIISSFHQELSDIYPTPVNWPSDIDYFLRSKFTVLQAAIGEFRHHLPVDEWEGFDNAWFAYYCSTGRDVDRQCQSYLHYISGKGVSVVDGKQYTHDNTKTYKRIFKDNVDQILKFAQNT